MGSHIIDGEFQSDKYPTCPPGKVPLSVKDKTAQDLLWEYAQRRREVDAEFSSDLEEALRRAGFVPPPSASKRLHIGDVVQHTRTDRIGTVTAVRDSTLEVWVDRTGPYPFHDFMRLHRGPG